MIQHNCRSCRAPMASMEGLAGREVACPQCGVTNIVPVHPPVDPGVPSAYPSVMAPALDRRGQAIASLVLGLVGLLAWVFPLAGAPVTIIGLVLGIKSLRSSGRGMAIAGIVLCIMGLVATLINAAIGAYMGATGQHSLVK